MNAYLLAYLGNVFALAFASIGVAFGQGLASFGQLDALERQPMGSEAGFRALIIGLGLTESGAVLALVAVLMSIFNLPSIDLTLGAGFAELGAGLAIGIVAAVVGIASSMSVRESCRSISRQPLFSHKITTFMLLTQSIIEAPIIFAFIIALIIKAEIGNLLSIQQGLRLFSAGLVIALGCVGPSIGQAIFVKDAAKAVGLNKMAYNKIFPFSLFSQAIIETPVIFSFFVSFLLIYWPVSSEAISMAAIVSIGSAISMGIGSLGAGISTGYVASKACLSIAANPDSYTTVLRVSLISQAIIESTVIYSFIVALFMIIRF